MANLYKDEYGAEFYLNGEYFKNNNGETYILKKLIWVPYQFVFSHQDMISIEYL